MLRILIIAGGFLAITAALLLMQPGQDPDARPQAANAPAARAPQAQVSRARSGLDLTAPAIVPGAGAGGMIRDPLGVAAAGSDDLQSLTANVLAGLGAASGSAPPAAPDELRTMTSGVLASLSAATSGQAAAGGPQSLENLIVQALRQGVPDDYIDALLNEAASTGQVAVPPALVTADGRVDTVTLLASLVQKSSGQAGIDTAALAIAARPTQRPSPAETYIVRPGDSLAAISYRFYGETTRFTDIFAANQDQLSSPDNIRIGQLLTIPAR